MTFQCDPQIIQCVFFAGEDLPQEICGIGGDWGNGSGMAEVGNLIQKLPGRNPDYLSGCPSLARCRSRDERTP